MLIRLALCEDKVLSPPFEQDLYTEYLGNTPMNDIKVTRTYPDPD